MKKWSQEAERIMVERFGKDTVIALATAEGGRPYVRYVNAYYENGAFYVITHALSNKIRQISGNPVVAIADDWFTAHGEGVNLDYIGKEENCAMADTLKRIFASWIDNGHTDFDDTNTILLRIDLTDGLLLSHGTRYEL